MIPTSESFNNLADLLIQVGIIKGSEATITSQRPYAWPYLSLEFDTIAILIDITNAFMVH